MALLGRESLLAKEELKIVKVPLNKKDFVFVRQMTGRERDKYGESLSTKVKDTSGEIHYEQNLADFHAKMIVYTLCNEKGELLLEPGDYAELNQNMSAKSLQTISDAAQKLNKISDEDKDALVKNSDAAPSGDSGSDSV